ncbi:MAG: PKD domain-containing protein, partial [Robiginitalea sp.]|nr:PKD domain-containing protein [Robiginitalea sp.]
MGGLVMAQGPPNAVFLTDDEAWCDRDNNQSTAEILITGEVDTSRFELHLELRGAPQTLVNLPEGVFTLFLNNQLGRNEYIIHKVVEIQEDDVLETEVGDTLVIEVHPYPDMSLSVDEGDFCSPADVVLRGSEGYASYTWDFGDGSSRTTSANWAIHSYEIPSDGPPVVFPTHLTIETAFGCTDEVDGSVEIYPGPEAAFTATPLVLQYPDLRVELSNETAGSWSYQWDFGDGRSSPSRDPVYHDYPTYGEYTITLEAYSAHCSDTALRHIQILPPPPEAGFEPDSAGCPPLTIAFENNSLYADSYVWDFDDGTGSTEVHPEHTFAASGEYRVSLQATGQSGSDQTEQIILVYDPPVADFTTDASGVAYTEHSFYNQSLNAVEYLWD